MSIDPVSDSNQPSKPSSRVASWLADRSEWLLKRLGIRTKEQSNLQALSTGNRGEALAADYLIEKKYQILFRSWRCPMGEIDLIAVDRNHKPNVLVFVEVKSWSSKGNGDPSQAVDEKKQQRLTRLAQTFLKQKKMLRSPARFDVISVVLIPLTIRHFENAFPPTGKYQWFS